MENKKNKKELELESFNVVVCKEKSLQSFLNVFHFKEENLDKAKLGEVFGVINILDHSEQSAYLPNLIAQVIRKEFFINTKLSSEESFEKSLKKANVALSDLTRHEVVGWIGKMHAVMGVIQDDNFFFTQSGGGKILLSRENKINDISRDLDENTNNHPLKTFSNISSGKLIPNDKIIFTTNSLFDHLSWEDLKRHTQTFNSNEFDNLVKSTIESEGENVALITINVKEKEITPIASLPRTKKTKTQNFFGKDEPTEKKERDDQTNKESSNKNISKSEASHEEEKPSDNNKEKSSGTKELSPFEMQPELFIKEGDISDDETEKQREQNVIGRLKSAVEKTKEDGAALVDKIKAKKEKSRRETSTTETIKEETIVIEDKTAPKQKTANLASKTKSTTIESNRETENVLTKPSTEKKDRVDILEKRKEEIHKGLSAFYEQPKQKEEKILISKEIPPKKVHQNEVFSSQENEGFFSFNDKNINSQKIKKVVAQKIRPQKIKEELSYHKEQYAHEIIALKNKLEKSHLTINDILRSRYLFSTIVVIFIIILILLLSLGRGKSENSTASPTNKTIQQLTTQENYIEEKEVEVKEIGKTDANIIDIAGYKNDLYAITDNNSLYKYDSNVNNFGGVPITDGIKETITLVSMPVLNLLFFISNDTVYSYSPVLDRFDNHNIKMPANVDLIGAGVHSSFSFLYLFDKNSGQIYRYARTEGGFLPPTNWFEEAISTDNITDFAIDDGIRITYNDGTIEYYYQKKLENSFLLNTEPRVIPQKIYTDKETNFYYILDKENPRVLKIKKEDNSVEDQYWNKEFKNAKNLSVHEDKEVYIVTEDNKLLKFEL